MNWNFAIVSFIGILLLVRISRCIGNANIRILSVCTVLYLLLNTVFYGFTMYLGPFEINLYSSISNRSISRIYSLIVDLYGIDKSSRQYLAVEKAVQEWNMRHRHESAPVDWVDLENAITAVCNEYRAGGETNACITNGAAGGRFQQR